MRLAVLILNYIVVAMLGLAFLSLAGGPTDNQSGLIIELVIIGPAAILSLVYAHSSRQK
jgi:hypothetical protein